MFKVLLWRLSFEILNLRRYLGKDQETVQYFAFGANLDPKVLAKRKIKPIAEKDFVLRGYDLRFCHPGPWQGFGFAALEKSADGLTYGKLYTLTAIDQRRMDYYELVPFLNRYRRVLHEQDGDQFFFYQSCHATSDLSPSRTYLESILSGFEQARHVPIEYVSKLKATRVLEKHELVPAKDLTFFIPKMDKVPRWLKRYDQATLRMFVKYFKDKSVTERLINV